MSEETSSKLELAVDAFMEEKKFPQWMRTTLQALSKGKKTSQDIIDAVRKTHKIDLRETQEPDVAVICDGSEKYTIGQEFVGDALVYTGAYVLDKDGKPTREFERFLALVGFKHLHYVYHDKSSASRRIGIIHDYHAGLESRLVDIIDASKREDGITPDPDKVAEALRDYAVDLKSIYDTVITDNKVYTDYLEVVD